MSKPKYQYKRVTQFYETDAMGIIHHGNYVLYLEEARLQFLRKVYGNDVDLLKDINFPLISCHVDYQKAIGFNEEVCIDYQVSTEGARLIFEYILNTKSFNKPVAFGKTVHVAYDMHKQRAIKLPLAIKNFLTQKG